MQAATAAREAAQASAIAKRADAQASIMLLQAQRDIASQGEAIARMMGNEAQAREFRIQQLQIDIKITEAKAAAMKAEAEGAIAVAQATLEELRVKNALTPVKEAELAASIKIARAKIQEADAVRESTRVMDQAISNLNRFGNEAGRAGQAGAHAGAQVRDGWHGVAQSIDTATASLSKYAVKQSELGKGVTQMGGGFVNKDGMVSDAKGNTQVQFAWTRTSIIDYLKQAGLDPLLAEELSKQFLNARGGVDAIGNGAQLKWGGQFSSMSSALAKMAEFYKFDPSGKAQAAQMLAYQREVQGAGGTGTSTPASTGGGTHVIRVELPGGRSYDVDTTTAAGRSQLEQMTRDLANAARRAA